MLLKSAFSKLASFGLDFVYAPICPLTQSELKPDESIISKSIYYKFDIAGDPIELKSENFDNYIRNNSKFTKIYSLFSNFQESAELVYYIKYKKYFWLAEEVGEKLGEKIIKENGTDYDIIIPCPLHKVKLRSRGFNQAYYLAKGVNNILKTELANDIALRHKFTLTQTKLDLEQRRKNLEKVFNVNEKHRERISAKKVLLIDDVTTTGATLSSLAEEVYKFNPEIIDCATIIMA